MCIAFINSMEYHYKIITNIALIFITGHYLTTGVSAAAVVVAVLGT